MWKFLAVIALGFGAYILLLAIRNPAELSPIVVVDKIAEHIAQARAKA